jgi:Uma2 family endonuclease
MIQSNCPGIQEKLTMKAVFAAVPEHVLEWRRRTDADQWDEMWEGVLHMAPSPTRAHQDAELTLAIWLRQNWAAPNGCRVFTRINVAERGTWPDNYRIPDIVMLTPARFHIDRDEYFDGGPDAVVEIHSPDDEAYEKLDFYAKVGVREVWIIDRDSKQPEIFELAGEEYRKRSPGADNWLRSEVAGAEMRATGQAKLEIRLVGRSESSLLP